MHMACLWGRADLLRMLLAAGLGDLNAQTTKRAVLRTNTSWLIPSGSTPLHVACQCDFPDCVEILLAHGADTSPEDENKQTARAVAEDNDSIECQEFIEQSSVTASVQKLAI